MSSVFWFVCFFCSRENGIANQKILWSLSIGLTVQKSPLLGMQSLREKVWPSLLLDWRLCRRTKPWKVLVIPFLLDFVGDSRSISSFWCTRSSIFGLPRQRWWGLTANETAYPDRLHDLHCPFVPIYDLHIDPWSLPFLLDYVRTDYLGTCFTRKYHLYEALSRWRDAIFHELYRKHEASFLQRRKSHRLVASLSDRTQRTLGFQFLW